MDRLEKIRQLSEKGYNCAQVILGAFCDEYDLPEETALKLSYNLRAGCAFRGEICGAVSAALLVYGLAFGSADPKDERAEEIVYRLSKEHMEEFEKLHGSLQCKDLLGYDVSDSADMESITEQNLFKWKCPALVRDSAMILERKINEMISKTK